MSKYPHQLKTDTKHILFRVKWLNVIAFLITIYIISIIFGDGLDIRFWILGIFTVPLIAILIETIGYYRYIKKKVLAERSDDVIKAKAGIKEQNTPPPHPPFFGSNMNICHKCNMNAVEVQQDNSAYCKNCGDTYMDYDLHSKEER